MADVWQNQGQMPGPRAGLGRYRSVVSDDSHIQAEVNRSTTYVAVARAEKYYSSSILARLEPKRWRLICGRTSDDEPRRTSDPDVSLLSYARPCGCPHS